jgi:hypothetical protein
VRSPIFQCDVLPRSASRLRAALRASAILAQDTGGCGELVEGLGMIRIVCL